MKKLLIIEAVLFAVFFFTADKIEVIGFLSLLAFIFLPVFFLVKKILNKKQIKADFSTNTWVSTKPIVEDSKPKTIQEYLWLMDTEDIGNKFYRAYKEDLEENDDYHMTKKEILEQYYYGDKIYKYEPFSLPFKVEDGKVYSYIEDEKWMYVGSIKKREIAKYEQSKKTELYLMPNYFKKVNDETVEADSGDSYFGLEVTIEQ